MARYNTEMFCRFVYNPELSYDDLLAFEASLKLGLTGILRDYGGEFIHFEETGDAMRLQCVFAGHDEDLFHALCDRIAPLTDGRVEAGILFVDKDLALLHIYSLHDSAWRECCVRMPDPGPLTRAMADRDLGACRTLP